MTESIHNRAVSDALYHETIKAEGGKTVSARLYYDDMQRMRRLQKVYGTQTAVIVEGLKALESKVGKNKLK